MTKVNGYPPTNLHATDAPAALRFYADKFAKGETKRWDLAAHLMEQAAEIIEGRAKEELTNL
jgi:hypothetical protein